MGSCWSLLANFFHRRRGSAAGGRAASPAPRLVYNSCTPVATGHEAPPEAATGPATSAYCGNKIITTKYTWLTFLPKNIFEQLHRAANLYFVFIVILNFVPQVGAFGKEIAFIPLALVLAVTCVKDGVEDYARHCSDVEVNSRSCWVYDSSEQRYAKKRWSDIRVGDFVQVACNEVIPADLLLTACHGDDPLCCYIETANLDGESSLKHRMPVSCISHSRFASNSGVGMVPSDFHAHVECDQPNVEIYKFRGKLVPDGECGIRPTVLTKDNLVLRGSVLRNTDSVEGLVIYAGHETKAMLNTSGPRYKRSRLEQYMNRDVLWCVVILLFLCFFSAIGSGIWLGSWKVQQDVPYIPFSDVDYYIPIYQGFIVFWTYIIIYQAMVPLSLYASLEIVKVLQVYLIQQDRGMYDVGMDRRVVCRSLNITEDLGQVQHVFSDKTGTLTDNKMIFRALSVRSRFGPGQVYIDEDQLAMSASQGGEDDRKGDLSQRRFETSSSSLRAASVEGVAESMERSYPDTAEVQLRGLLQMAAGDDAPPDESALRELLLAMAVCNTVMVSSHSHRAPRRQPADMQEPLRRVDSSSQRSVSSSGSWGYRPLDVDSSTARGRGRAAGFARNLLTFLPRRLLPGLLPPGGSGGSSSLVGGSFSIQEERALRELYEAESPDELALVEAACRHGCRLVARTGDSVTVSQIGIGQITYDVLAVLPFDSNRRRMSVIVRHPATDGIVLYCKGADSAVLGRLATSSDSSDADFTASVEDHTTKFAMIGLRTLCIAKRELSASEFSSWHEHYLSAIGSQQHAADSADSDGTAISVAASSDDSTTAATESIERNLQLIGATGIEDKLQDGVGETIGALREAAITTWLLTGDKKETAVNVGRACGLVSASDDLETLPHAGGGSDDGDHAIACHLERLAAAAAPPGCRSSAASRQSIVAEGATLDVILKRPELRKLFLTVAAKCSTVLCCRMTPSQKAGMVDAVKRHSKALTLAIGDGANDVNMIRTAHVGVGITGVEGTQAAMAADFAISRFRYLRRLLFVHGHWCYDRLATAVLYNFYKNANLILVLFWYQFYNGFSGQVSMDQVYLLLFHVVFTSLPPIVVGVLDKDVPAAALSSRPFLYMQGPRDQLYHRASFWMAVLDAFYQSLAVFFLVVWACEDSDVGLWTFGTMQATFCVTVQLLTVALETKTWTIVHVAAWLLSCLLLWSTMLLLSATCVTYNPPSNPYWELHHAAASPGFWLLLTLVSCSALLPRVTAIYATSLYRKSKMRSW